MYIRALSVKNDLRVCILSICTLDTKNTNSNLFFPKAINVLQKTKIVQKTPFFVRITTQKIIRNQTTYQLSAKSDKKTQPDTKHTKDTLVSLVSLVSTN